MKLEVGKYFIANKDKCYWIHGSYSTIKINYIDEENELVGYSYIGCPQKRERPVCDFYELQLILLNPLIEELI
jgi:hypothetical protein